MKRNTLKNIVYFLLFYFACSNVVFVMATINDYISIGIMTIWWQLSGISVLLLAVIFMCEKAISKEKGAHRHYHKFNPKLLSQIKANVWRWVYSSFLKILQILSRFKVSPQVRQANDTTDNHSLHTANLPKENNLCQPKKNDTALRDAFFIL